HSVGPKALSVTAPARCLFRLAAVQFLQRPSAASVLLRQPDISATGLVPELRPVPATTPCSPDNEQDMPAGRYLSQRGKGQRVHLKIPASTSHPSADDGW